MFWCAHWYYVSILNNNKSFESSYDFEPFHMYPKKTGWLSLSWVRGSDTSFIAEGFWFVN
jgi:hypothetical protein